MSAPMSIASTNDQRAARATWAAHYADPHGYRWMPSEELVRFVGRVPSIGRVLEVGCGNGANLWFLAEHTAECAVGLDFYPDALRVARELCASHGCGQEDLRDSEPGRRCYKSPALLLVGDARRLPLADESFDTVVDCMISQHVPWAEHLALYREYARVLRRRGRLFLYHLTARTTGFDPGRVDYSRGIRLFPDAGLISLPYPEQLGFLVASAGFKDITRRGLAREYPDAAVAHYAVIEGIKP